MLQLSIYNSKMESKKTTYVIAIIGADQSGKSTWVNRFTTGQFKSEWKHDKIQPVSKIPFKTNHGLFELICIEYLTTDQIPDVDGIVLMFNVTHSHNNLDLLCTWRKNTEHNCPTVLVGTAVDHPDRNIMPKYINNKSDIQDLRYYDISSKSYYNYDKPFLYLLRQMSGHDDLIFIAQSWRDLISRRTFSRVATLEQAEQNLDLIHWDELTFREEMLPLVEKNLDKLTGFGWVNLSRQTSDQAIHILSQNLDKFDWYYFSGNTNPKAVHILEQNLDKVNWGWLSGNPMAVHILEQHLDKVDWFVLSSNPMAVHILEQNLDKVDWRQLSSNPNAIHLLEQNLDKVDSIYITKNPNAQHILKAHPHLINWEYLSDKSDAIDILQDHLDKVDWNGLSRNEGAIEIIENNLDKVDWFNLSQNRNAMHIIKNNLDKVDWHGLSFNKNPEAMQLLEENLEHLNNYPHRRSWDLLSSNPNAIHILKKNLDRVDWTEFGANKNGHLMLV